MGPGLYKRVFVRCMMEISLTDVFKNYGTKITPFVIVGVQNALEVLVELLSKRSGI
jgi:hypothetical protein